jgi:hypothetical protein
VTESETIANKKSLADKGRVKRIRKGFCVIVPVEFAAQGITGNRGRIMENTNVGPGGDL